MVYRHSRWAGGEELVPARLVSLIVNLRQELGARLSLKRAGLIHPR
jgi:hypothetical protein